MKDQANKTAGESGSIPDMLRDPLDFSLVLGGPLFQFFRRMNMEGEAGTLLLRRIVIVSLFAWLPLLLISVLEGNVLGKSVAIPFLRDFEVHIKFLLTIPLLVAAELVVHKRMRYIVRQFLDRHLIPDSAKDRFNEVVSSAIRLRNSVLAEVLLIIFVYSVGITVIWRNYTALDAATWYATPSGGSALLSYAGMWYGYVSLPVFQFLLLRWYFRLFIWARFLWQVSRIELNLMPTHPDRLGGLGFVSGAAHAFAILATAHGALLAGNLANRIFYMGASLPDYKAEIAIVVIFMLLAVFGPLLVFSAQLAHVKRKGKMEYDTLAQRYVREFDSKWLRGGASPDEPLVGSGDIQSLADLGNSLEVVRSMRVFPITKDGLVQVVAATMLPLAPLALTMMPLEEIVKKLFGVLF